MVKNLLFRRARRREAGDSSSGVPSSQSSQSPGVASETGVTEADARSLREDELVKVDPWWRGSSFDLLRGLDVREVDTVPAEVFDELFADAASRGRHRR